MNWIYLFIAIALEVVGTVALKSSKNFSNLLYSLITIVSYCVSLYYLSLTLKTIPIGIAYAVWAGFGMASITLIGYLFFKQKLDVLSILGIALIVIGVIVLNLSSKETI